MPVHAQSVRELCGLPLYSRRGTAQSRGDAAVLCAGMPVVYNGQQFLPAGGGVKKNRALHAPISMLGIMSNHIIDTHSPSSLSS